MRLVCKIFSFLLGCLIIVSLAGCDSAQQDTQRVLKICPGNKITTLDPALAADTASQYMTAAFYDTPLQYSFMKRPYTLEPSMLEAMPVYYGDGRSLHCRLRKDLLFQESKCFPDRNSRKVKAHDVVFSILRLADPRVHSTGYWLIRGRIAGIEKFRELAGKAKPGDFSPYDRGCPGLQIHDEHSFSIHLNAPDPGFIYALAMPYFATVSRRAVEFYGEYFADHPAGSGPFILTEWSKDYVIKARRNPEFREEYFKEADNPADRTKRLPLMDSMVCYLVKQPLAVWLMFLQGELDYCGLSGENFDAVVNEKNQLSPALTNRKIKLFAYPEFEIDYIGFYLGDPLLGKNKALRQAISLAFDKGLRSRITNGRLRPVYGPLPPGTDGYEADYRGKYGEKDLQRARELMRKAGYPDGIDPATKKPLELEFDQAGSNSFYRQNAELLANDLKEIGIQLRPGFSNRARFFQKLASGQMQLFRMSWTGDYPDAENFFQLFYGPNSGTCNRVCFRNRKFDAMYEKIRIMPQSPERSEIYRTMTRILTEECPWIFESQPVSYMLTHCWMQNYHPHDFGFNRWKYLSVDPKLRNATRKNFIPLDMSELRSR